MTLRMALGRLLSGFSGLGFKFGVFGSRQPTSHSECMCVDRAFRVQGVKVKAFRVQGLG